MTLARSSQLFGGVTVGASERGRFTVALLAYGDWMSDNSEETTRVGRSLVVATSGVQAMALASIPVVGGPLSTLLTQLAIDKLERGLHELESAFEKAARERQVDTDELAERVAASPRLTSLVGRAADTAISADDEVMRRLAGRLLREGLVDDAAIDRSRFLAGTLRRIEPVHLRVLGEIANHRVTIPGVDGPGRAAMSVVLLEQRWTDQPDLLPAILATLEAEALIVKDMSHVTMMTRPLTAEDARERYWATSYGAALQRYCAECDGPTANER